MKYPDSDSEEENQSEIKSIIECNKINETYKENIRDALRQFIVKDKEKLLRVDIYEPTISHRIAVYLENLFPDFDVDCEYNKNSNEGKEIEDKKNRDGKKIRPDVIIHNRGSIDNIVIIEVKKSGIKSKLAKTDIEKLEKCMNGALKYKLGVFVGVLKRKIDICWIEENNNKITKTIETLENKGLRGTEWVNYTSFIIQVSIFRRRYSSSLNP